MNQEKRNYLEHAEEYRYLRPASTQDCTGLIPEGAVDEQTLEDYEELYPFLPSIPRGSKYRTEYEKDF